MRESQFTNQGRIFPIMQMLGNSIGDATFMYIILGCSVHALAWR